MCGIAGVYEYGLTAGSVREDVLLRMRDTLTHRGPDEAGHWISGDRRVGLGSRRLSIVDLAGGSQPMFGRNGEVLVYNGEIYNFPELRRELEAEGVAFETRCDTEVIVRLYERMGEHCVTRLEGMFAFAIWDPRRNRLLLARDAIGEKPLYWTTQNGRLLFASEIKAILEHPAVHAEVNADAIPGYLANLVASPPETLYRHISKLPAGTYALCEQGRMTLHRYWDLFEPREFVDPSPGEAAATVRTLLEKATTARLLADVDIGVLLSGGLDSTTLVALLRGRSAGIPTFSVGYPGQSRLDEREAARRVARHFGTDHHEVEVGEADALGFFSTLVHHQDEPLADPVCVPLHFVCRLAADAGIKVVLAGEGADELFWGYRRYGQIMGRLTLLRCLLGLPRPLRRTLARSVSPRRRMHLREILTAVASGRPLPMSMPLGLSSHYRRQVLGGPGSGVYEGWAPRSYERESVEARLAFDTQEYEFALRLPELLLMRIDRFSMANSVEARVPFLDPTLVRYAYRLSLRHKLVHGQGKVVLRHAVSEIVPQWVLERRKQGFGAPVEEWFGSRTGALLARYARDPVLGRYFDREGLERMIAEAGREPRLAFSLWPILNFALWHKYWIEGDALDSLFDA